MNVFGHLALAHLKNGFRDRMVLFWFFAFPVVFMVIFGIVFGGERDSFSLTVGLVNEGESPYGMVLSKALEHSHAVRLFSEEFPAALEALQGGKRDLVVQVEPEGATLYYGPQSEEKAQFFATYLKSAFLEMELRQRGGIPGGEVTMRRVGTAHFRQMDYFLPGVLAMAIMQLGLFGALDFVSLRERKIIRHLGATPLRRELLLWSEILVRMGISLLQTGFIVATGWLIFKVQVLGSIPLLLLWVLFGSATFVSLGYFVASFTRTIESAEGIIQMVQFPMMFLSGIFFSPEMMPESLRFVPRLLPLSYFGDALRNVMVGIPSQFGLGRDFVVLLGWLGASSFLAVRFFRWE